MQYQGGVSRSPARRRFLPETLPPLRHLSVWRCTNDREDRIAARRAGDSHAHDVIRLRRRRQEGLSLSRVSISRSQVIAGSKGKGSGAFLDTKQQRKSFAIDGWKRTALTVK